MCAHIFSMDTRVTAHKVYTLILPPPLHTVSLSLFYLTPSKAKQNHFVPLTIIRFNIC